MIDKQDLAKEGGIICLNQEHDMILHLDPSASLTIGCRRVTIQGSKFSTNELLIDDCISIYNSTAEKKLVIRKDTESYKKVFSIYREEIVKQDKLILTMQPV